MKYDFKVIISLISWGQKNLMQGMFTAIAFLIGATTSMLCGYMGMSVATYSNVRTTVNAMNPGYESAYNTGSLIIKLF